MGCRLNCIDKPVFISVSRPSLTEFGIRPTEIGMAIAIELEMLTALHASKILKQRCSLILASIKLKSF